MGRYPEADLAKLSITSVSERATKVSVAEFARPLDPAAARAVLAALPDQLAGTALREIVARTVAAHRAGRPVVAMVGGHVIKTGVTPALIALLDRGVLRHVAMNGAAAIHDVEIARIGRTSEDVEANLHQGTFGMVDETGDFMNDAMRTGADRGEGLGECWGRALEETRAPHRAVSLLAGVVAVGIEKAMTRTELARSRRQLSQLDERLLRDIGIDRATARFEANKGYWS